MYRKDSHCKDLSSKQPDYNQKSEGGGYGVKQGDRERRGSRLLNNE